jgi:zinc resistance-associated protein
MLKPIIIGATACALAAGTLAFAQDGPRGPMGMDRGGFGPHRQLSPEDIKAFTDARIAALKAGLALTAEQEKNWPPFEQAMRELAKARAERMQAWAQGAGAAESDPIARLQQRADALSRRGTLLKQLATAAAPLYQSLDEAQKRRFHILARFERGRGGGMHHGFGHMREHWRGGFGEER